MAASPHGFCCGSGISPWTTACCPCRYFAPAAETNFVHAAIDSMPFLSVASIHRVQQLLFWGAARHWTTSCCPRWHFVPAAETSFEHVA